MNKWDEMLAQLSPEGIKAYWNMMDATSPGLKTKRQNESINNQDENEGGFPDEAAKGLSKGLSGKQKGLSNS